VKWVGLTGGIATGKSTVAQLLREHGLPVVDADELARQVVTPGALGLRQVVDRFGTKVLSPDQTLNRQALGQIVFQDQKARNDLEAILHPLIQQRRASERRRLEDEGQDLAFYDVPLLFEKNLQDEFDFTVLVYAPLDLQGARLAERDGLSEHDIDLRIRSQLPIDEKRALADYVISNTGDLAHLKAQVDRLLEKLQSSQ